MSWKRASLAQWGCCTNGLLSLCGRPCVGTVFWSGSVWLGTCLVWILHYLPPFPPAPFFRHGIIVWENEKSRPPWNRRTAWNRELTASALFENKKSWDSRGLCAPRIPADSDMIIFWKLYKYSAPFLEFPWKSKRALLIFHSNRGCGLLNSGDIYSQRNDIYEIHEKCVNILPKKLKQFHCNNCGIKWNVHYKLNFSQLISIVYTTNGAADGTRTRTVSLPGDFKSPVSTDSTTAALCQV